MSRLEELSLPFRKKLIAKNIYNENDKYEISHPNALSNGDEKGKGELNGQVGGLTDIKTRESLLTKNIYNKNREYNDSTA